MRRSFSLVLVFVLLVAPMPVGAQQRGAATDLTWLTASSEDEPLARAARVEARRIALEARGSQQSPAVTAVKAQARRVTIGDRLIVTLVSGERIRGRLVEVREGGIGVLMPKDKGYDNFGNKVRAAVPETKIELPYENIASIKKPLSGAAIAGIIAAVWVGLSVVAYVGNRED